MKHHDIHSVCIVGAGTMGTQIALQCARFGCTVMLYDVKTGARDNALEQMRCELNTWIAEGVVSAEEAHGIRERIHPASSAGSAALNADLLIESVPEKPEIKWQVFSQFDTLCPPKTIFVTNTSIMALSMLSPAIQRQERFAALHFHPPVRQSKIVDIMPHAGTSRDTMTRLELFTRSIGQIPIVLQTEKPGYVFVNLQGSMVNMALDLAIDGIASIEDIDRSWMGVTGMSMGPFGLIDYNGIDVWLHTTQYRALVLGGSGLQRKVEFLRRYVERGDLGMKSGRGFYTYPHPAYEHPGFLKTQYPEQQMSDVGASA